MENGETTIEGALRETYEEARVKGLNPRLFSVISLPAWNQIHLFYRVDMPDFSFETTPESNDVRLFSESDIPWDSLAFRTVIATIQHHINLKEGSITVLNAHFDQ